MPMFFHTTSNRRVWLAAGLLIVISSGLAAANRPAAILSLPQQTASPTPTTDTNYAVFVRVCGNCHDSGRITSARRSRVDWEDVINTMVTKGAEGTDQDFENVLKFLLHFYGKVYVNRCTSADLVDIVQLTQKDADAIVAYRKDKGNFTDFDALAKVPGVDVKILEAHREAIAF